MNLRLCYFTAIAALLALMALCLTWELWLAPVRPGGSSLALKALPLLLPLRGLLQGRRRTFQWSTLFILAYVMEGATRLLSDQGTSQILAGTELALAIIFFSAATGYARVSGRSLPTIKRLPAD